jgi:hypothetical protein
MAHLIAVDLDQDGRLDVLACDAREDEVIWLRNLGDGRFEESVIASQLRAPVHVEAADLDRDGDLDLLVASMGIVYPSNSRTGTVFVLENDGGGGFSKRAVIEDIARVTDVRSGDFNSDGRIDLAIGQFGYEQGEVRWMEQTGPWEFRSHPLLNLSGTVNVCVSDFDGNGSSDIAALVSQQWEEIHLFLNDGRGNFRTRIIFGSTNEDFACSGMTVADLNRDGRPDLLFTNGDGFGPTPNPGPRPWHGVQWLENRDSGEFHHHRIGDLAGAYGPIAVDLDKDGRLDVVAVSAFNDWSDPRAISMMWFRSDGRGHFSPRILARRPTHLLTVAAGDFDGTGEPQLVTGAFHAWPPFDRSSRLTYWRSQKAGQ